MKTAPSFDATEDATLADVEPDVQSGSDGDSSDGGETAALSADDRDRIEAIETKLNHAAAALPDAHVSKLREEAATLAGTDSYDAALEEL